MKCVKSMSWVLLPILLVVGCASTSVRSALLIDKPIDMNKLYVVINAPSWSANYGNMLDKYVRYRLSPCLSMDVLVLHHDANISQADIDKKMYDFGTTAILGLNLATDKGMSQGIMEPSPNGFIFEARLVSVSDNKEVWQAKLDTSSHFYTSDAMFKIMDSMATKLRDAMIHDGLITCEIN